MEKLTFTKEHDRELKDLFVDLSFGGHVMEGRMGANVITPYDVITNTSMDTLKATRSGLKKSIQNNNDDYEEFTGSRAASARIQLMKKWERFIYLTIGHKFYIETLSKRQAELRELRAKYKRLEEENKTPAERLKEMKAQIADLSKAVDE